MFQCSNSLLHSYGLTEMLVDILWSSVTKEGFEHKAVSEISIHEIWKYNWEEVWKSMSMLFLKASFHLEVAAS